MIIKNVILDFKNLTTISMGYDFVLHILLWVIE